MKIVETEAKSLIQKSKIPSIAYVANPYTGCILGCAYCYASFMGRAVGQTVKDWGEYVYVKTNAVELGREELKRMPADRREGTFLLSSVTDPYQGPERRYLLTRGILNVLAEERYPRHRPHPHQVPPGGPGYRHADSPSACRCRDDRDYHR